MSIFYFKAPPNDSEAKKAAAPKNVITGNF